MELQNFIASTLDRMQQALDQAVKGLSQEELKWQPSRDAHSIGFAWWHLLRVEDAQVQATMRQKPQLWESEKWREKMGMPAERGVGYGYTAEQLAAFPVPSLADLKAYGEAARAQTRDYLKGLAPEKFDEILKTRFFGEVSVGNLLSGLLCELALHIGQMAYLRGLQRGLNK